jgi:hypothetical protein
MRDESARIWKVGDALSQLANVALMPNHKQSNANESISGRAYRQQWRIRHVINLLFFWQEDHCKGAYELDLARARALLDEA